MFGLAKNRRDEGIEITYEDTVQCTKRVKHGKARGPDQTNAEVLSSCICILAKPLHVLF